MNKEVVDIKKQKKISITVTPVKSYFEQRKKMTIARFKKAVRMVMLRNWKEYFK